MDRFKRILKKIKGEKWFDTGNDILTIDIIEKDHSEESSLVMCNVLKIKENIETGELKCVKSEELSYKDKVNKEDIKEDKYYHSKRLGKLVPPTEEFEDKRFDSKKELLEKYEN